MVTKKKIGKGAGEKKKTSVNIPLVLAEKAKRVFDLHTPGRVIYAGILAASEMPKDQLEELILRVVDMTAKKIEDDMHTAAEQLKRPDDQSNQGRGKAKGA